MRDFWELTEQEDPELTWSSGHTWITATSVRLTLTMAQGLEKRPSTVNCREEATMKGAGGAQMWSRIKVLMRLTTDGRSTEKGEERSLPQ